MNRRQDPEVAALPRPLRSLLVDLVRIEDQLYARLRRHEAGHGHCHWGTILPNDHYCPVHDALSESWRPVFRLRSAIEWFLLDRGGIHRELLCSYCQGDDRPGTIESPEPRDGVGLVCAECHAKLTTAVEDRESIARAAARDWSRANLEARGDYDRDAAKDRDA